MNCRTTCGEPCDEPKSPIALLLSLSFPAATRLSLPLFRLPTKLLLVPSPACVTQMLRKTNGRPAFEPIRIEVRRIHMLASIRSSP
jgi:hypothetical protein